MPETVSLRRQLGVLRTQIFTILCCACLAACGAPRDESPSPSAAASQVKVRVMAFNIEWGGTHVSFEKVVEAIRRAEPDIVAVQEAQGNLERLAAELEWHHDTRNHVIARHRLIDPSGAGGRYVLVEVSPGLVVAVANVHLPSSPYGEDLIRDGHSVDEVIALERRVRLPVIQPFLEVLPQLASNGMPVFLAGDFNSPSHRDWTPAAIHRWPRRRYSVEWPVAKAVEAAGFRDSYRQQHSDPLEHPGFTWWADRPAIPDYNPGSPDSWQSRIDFLWYTGPVEVTGSTLVGESGAPDVTVEVNPWPSDHRAVLSDFVVEAAPLPFIATADKRRYAAGEPVSIVYRNRTSAGAIIIASESTGSGRGMSSRRIGLTSERSVLELNEPLPASGRYRLTLKDNQRQIVSRDHFWVLPADAQPLIEVASESFEQGNPISLTWRNAPGNRYDWVGLYAEDDSTDKESYLAWAHVDARIEGTMTFDASNAIDGWPPPPGRYVVRLMIDDGFVLLAESAPFEIRETRAGGH